MRGRKKVPNCTVRCTKGRREIRTLKNRKTNNKISKGANRASWSLKRIKRGRREIKDKKCKKTEGKMFRNPTLQIQTIPKSKRMEMAIESIKETHTLEKQQVKMVQKEEKKGFDKDKFNVLIRRSIWELKKNEGKNHTRKKESLDQVNFDKQLDEIEILISIIKKTGKAPQKQTNKPMVHVPLPRGKDEAVIKTSAEFYELKPSVPFKNSSKMFQKTHESYTSRVHKGTLTQPYGAHLESQQVPDLPKRVPQQPVSRKSSESFYQEKPFVEHKRVIRYERATSTTSEDKPKFDKATITTSRSLSIEEKKELKFKSEPVKETELESEVPREVVRSKDSAPRDKKVLREMSTISSFSGAPNVPVSYDSIELVSNKPGFYEVVNAHDLYVTQNSWTLVDPVEDDPLKNSKKVVVKTLQKIGVESESDRVRSKALKRVDNYHINGHKVVINGNSNHSNKVPNGTENKPQVSPVNAKKAKETSTPRKVSYSEETPQLDLSEAQNYMKRQARELRVNVDRRYIDSELQEEFNKMEASLFNGLIARDSSSDFSAKESATSAPLEPEDQTEHPIPEEKEKKQKTERPSSRQKARSRSKSQKRSKKDLPEIHLSDYKGFYVVHTTNDWTLC